MDLTRRLQGKRIRWVATDEKVLVVACTDGTEVRIKWKEGEGPVFAGQDMKVILPTPAPPSGVSRSFNGGNRLCRSKT